MPYKCTHCGQATQSNVRCDKCRRVFLDPQTLEVIKESPVPSTKTGSGTVQKSSTSGPTVQTNGGPNKVTKKLDDPPTRQVISEKVANHRFARGRKDQIPVPSVTSNGPGGTDGTTNKTTDGLPPRSMPRPPLRGVGEQKGSDGPTTKTTNGPPPGTNTTQVPPRGVGETRTPQTPPKEETQETGAKELIAEAKDLLMQLEKLLGKEAKDKELKVVVEAVKERTLLPTVENLRVRVPKARTQLVGEAKSLLTNLKSALGQEKVNVYVQRIRVTADPKGQAPETLLHIVKELKSLSPESGRRPEPSGEELKRKEEEERNRKLEEERKRKEEEERQRQEELKRKQEEERKRLEEEERKRLEEEERKRLEEERQKRNELESRARKVLGALFKGKVVSPAQAKKYSEDLKSAKSASAVEIILRELAGKVQEWKRQEEERKRQEELKRQEEEERNRKLEEERKRKEEEERKRQEELKRKQEEERKRNEEGERKRQEELKRRQEEQERKRKQEEQRKQPPPPRESPVGGEVGDKINKLTNSEEERKALLKLPPKVAQNMADLLGKLAEQGKSAGRQFANLSEAKVALREADRKISEGPLKKFNALKAAVEKLRDKLVEMKHNAENIKSFVKGELERADYNFGVSPDEGLKTLQHIWDQLKNQKPEATKSVQEGQEWKQYETEQKTVEEAKSVAAAARPLAALEGSLRHGPLSKLVPGKLSEEDTIKIIQLYEKDPELADYALDLSQRAAHPEVVVKGLAVVGDVASSGFEKGETPAQKRSRTRAALDLGCALGGDYFDRMKAYYQTDAPTRPNTLHDPKTPGEKGLGYTRAIAGKLLNQRGEIDFSGATDVLNALHFHPKSLDEPLPSLALTVEEFRKEVAKDPRTYNGVLNGDLGLKLTGVQKTTPTSKGLIQKTLGKTGPVGPQDGKIAVLSGMLTPLSQGQVGSCHATSVCIKFRANEPLQVMKDLVQIVNDGKMTKGGRPPVPVITNIEDKENTLLRSWEYTVATAGARLDHNQKKKRLTEDLLTNFEDQDPAFNLTALESEVTNAKLDWKTAKRKIQDELAATFDYRYNPKAQIGGTASDQSSTAGKWELVMKVGETETVVGSETEYKQHLKNTIKGALKKVGLRDGSAPLRKVDDIVNSPQFLGNLKVMHNVKGNKDDGMPWNQGGGGRSEYETALLFPGQSQTPLSLYKNPEVPSEKKSPSEKPTPRKLTEKEKAERTKVIFSGVMSGLLAPTGGTSKDPKKDLVALGVEGSHDMNALPGHPSLEPLRGENPEEVRDKVQKLLVERGKEIADTPLKTDKLNYLYDKAVGSFVGDVCGDDLTDFTEQKNRPAGEMKPGEFKALILKNAAPKIRQLVEKNYERNKASFTKQTLKEYYEKQLTGKIDGFLLKELEYPEFTFADTNWGDPSDHTLLVVGSDPSTGEPKMFQKTEFGGDYKDGNENWLDLEWTAVTLK